MANAKLHLILNSSNVGFKIPSTRACFMGYSAKLSSLDHWQKSEPGESRHICAPFWACVGTYDQKALVCPAGSQINTEENPESLRHGMKLCQFRKQPHRLCVCCVWWRREERGRGRKLTRSENTEFRRKDGQGRQVSFSKQYIWWFYLSSILCSSTRGYQQPCCDI